MAQQGSLPRSGLHGKQEASKRNGSNQPMFSRFWASLGLNRGAKRNRSTAAGNVAAASLSISASTAFTQQQETHTHHHGATYGLGPLPQPGAISTTPDLGFPRGLEERFIIDKELGKGGNGVVRVVVDRQTGEKFACKSIRKVLTDASEKKKAGHLESIKREIHVLTKLNGSLNIVKLEDVFEDDDCVHIVMELCQGGELWHHIGECHYSERTVASFMRAVLRTLAQCHSHHILHRDIKPGNFMLLSSDERAPLKAIDFGLAAPFDPACLPRTDLGLEGTPWYMAPETLRSEWLPASDIWSAGVMAFQLLSGRFPFDDKKNVYAPAVTAIWRSVMNDPLDFSGPWWNEISNEAKDFCRWLLNRDPSKRPTAKEALRHTWLKGTSAERSVGKRINQSVVARIQRFAAGSHFKRTVLQSIAAELLTHPALARERERCAVSDQGRPLIMAPDSACLQPLFSQLKLDQGTAVGPEQLQQSLEAMGFKLDPTEVARLLEQVDLEGTGGMDKAAFAASQMDWRQLQQNYADLWLEMASRAFRSLDVDQSGILEVDELLRCLREKLPPDEVTTALELLLQEAGSAPDARGIDFDGFLQMLKVGSLDSLDLYDDRMSHRSNGSGHGSMDRLNSLLDRSVRTGDWSRHGPLADGSGTSRVSDVVQMSDNEKGVQGTTDINGSLHGSLHGGRKSRDFGAGGPWRFDVTGKPPASAPVPIPGAQQPGAIAFRFDVGKPTQVQAAAPAGPQGTGTAWRFDVGAKPTPKPAEPPKMQWRFDVGRSQDTGAVVEPVTAGAGASSIAAAAGGSGSGRGGRGASGAASSLSALGRQGGYFDRRHHGSTLYCNVALNALQASGQRATLTTVAE